MYLLIKDLYDKINLSKYRYEFLTDENLETIDDKYYTSWNYQVKKYFVYIKSIKNVKYCYYINKSSLTYNIKKINMKKIDSDKINFNFHNKLFQGTCFDGDMFDDGNFRITDVYILCGIKLADNIVNKMNLLKKYNLPKNMFFANYVNLADYKQIFNNNFETNHLFKPNGIAFMPKKSGKKYIHKCDFVFQKDTSKYPVLKYVKLELPDTYYVDDMYNDEDIAAIQNIKISNEMNEWIKEYTNFFSDYHPTFKKWIPIKPTTEMVSDEDSIRRFKKLKIV